MRYEFIEAGQTYSFIIAEPKEGYKIDDNGLDLDISLLSDKRPLHGNDSDGAWKYALEVLFFEFLQLFFPKIYDLLDTGFKPESKETELKELLPGLKSKQRIVDKLVRVKYKDGKSAFLMIHIEVESKTNTYIQQKNFAARMYEYFTMLNTKFKDQDILNIGVLINSHGLAMSKSQIFKDKSFVTNQLSSDKQTSVHNDFLIHKQLHLGGQELSFKFPVIHLAKWAEREDELKVLAYKNPFAIMVLYQLIALKYKNKNKRLNAKVQIMRLGNQYGYDAETIRVLFYLIDWVITLPIDLQREYYKEVRKMEAEVKERFVSIYEIMGKEEGLAEGLEQGQAQGQVNMLIKQMGYKFNNIPDTVVERIKSASLDQIETWSLSLLNAKTIDDVFNS